MVSKRHPNQGSPCGICASWQPKIDVHEFLMCLEEQEDNDNPVSVNEGHLLFKWLFFPRSFSRLPWGDIATTQQQCKLQGQTWLIPLGNLSTKQVSRSLLLEHSQRGRNVPVGSPAGSSEPPWVAAVVEARWPLGLQKKDPDSRKWWCWRSWSASLWGGQKTSSGYVGVWNCSLHTSTGH